MRRLQVVLVFIVAACAWGQDAPPPAVPLAVKALEYLKPQPSSGPTAWTNGPYGYDGAGNIKTIGSEFYVYDKIGRLKTATLRGPDLSSMQTQSFDYDDYGNLIRTSKLGQTTLLPASSANQLETLHYDGSGRVDIAGTQHYDYDAAGMPNAVRLGSGLQPRIIYAYTADDERLFAFDVSTGITHWTLRGFDNKVLRDFKQTGATWSVERDYVYRDGLLLAALKPSGAVEHYSLDHLGTPRLITDGAGHKVGYHVYWPFGEEWSPGDAQEASPLKFTGHERDADPTGGTAALDYLHARYYGAGWARFMSVDPALDVKRALASPQLWNRYAYAMNNPVSRTDPTGTTDGCPTCKTEAEEEAVRRGAADGDEFASMRLGEVPQGLVDKGLGPAEFVAFGLAAGFVRAGSRGAAETLFEGGAKSDVLQAIRVDHGLACCKWNVDCTEDASRC